MNVLECVLQSDAPGSQKTKKLKSCGFDWCVIGSSVHYVFPHNWVFFFFFFLMKINGSSVMKQWNLNLCSDWTYLPVSSIKASRSSSSHIVLDVNHGGSAEEVAFFFLPLFSYNRLFQGSGWFWGFVLTRGWSLNAAISSPYIVARSQPQGRARRSVWRWTGCVPPSQGPASRERLLLLLLLLHFYKLWQLLILPF